MRALKSCLTLLIALTLTKTAQALVDPCQISNVTVWIADRPLVTKFNCQSNVKINATELKDAPNIQYIGPAMQNDRFTLILLKLVPNEPAQFDVHWFIANISPDRDFFLTKNKTNAIEYIVYKRPTPGDYHVYVFKQNTSGPAPQGPGFSTQNLFSLNKWMDNNAKAIINMIGATKFQVVNNTIGRPPTAGSPQSFYPPIPVMPGSVAGGSTGYHPPPPPQQQPPYNPQYQPPYNPQHQPPPYQGGGGGGGAPGQVNPSHSQPFPPPYPGVQNPNQTVHHYHQHEVVKKKKNASPSISISLALLGMSTLLVLL